MEHEFSNEAHQLTSRFPSLPRRKCVVEGQTANKECPERAGGFLAGSVHPLGVQMRAWHYREGGCVRGKSLFSVCCDAQPGNLKFLYLVLPKDLTKEKTSWWIHFWPYDVTETEKLVSLR